jgi:hypothetical protein
MTSARLTQLTSQHTGISASRIHSKSQTLPACIARYAIWHMLKKAGWSNLEIGDHFDRTRRAVDKGIKISKALIQTDHDFQTLITNLTNNKAPIQ